MSNHEKTSPEAQPDVNRRRVLQGLSTLPAVVTLTAVSGNANASLLCTANPTPEPAGVTDRTVNVDGTDYLYRCKPDTTSATVGTADIGDPIVTVPSPVLPSDPGAGAIGETTRLTGVNKQCAIYIDGTGTQVSFNSASGNPITASCMVSLGLVK